MPFNIASYALLQSILANILNLIPGEFVHTFGDAHIYTNHFDQVNLQMSRECKLLPEMKINKDIDDIFNFKFDDFELVNYEYHPHIKGKVAV